MTPDTPDATTLDDEDILALVHSGSRKLERQIRWRDWREVVAAAIVAIFIAPAALRGSLLGRAGAMVILAGLVLVVFRLWAARRGGGAGGVDRSLAITEALRAELRRVDAQIGLLESVAWWYVTPLLGGSVLLVAGRSAGKAPWVTVAYAVFVVLLGWGIVKLNMRAVRHVLRPKRDELLSFLAQLEK